MDFSNRVCLVTGGGSGIGRATCQRFACLGADVVVVDVNAPHGHETVQLIAAGRKGRAIFAAADVSDAKAVENAVELAIRQWGKIDVVVNNAAIMTFDPVVKLSEADWDRVLAVNLKSVFLFSKYAAPRMRHGAIINVSSVHAHETTKNVSPYVASKGGMEAFCRALAIELTDQDVRVNCVAPGAVDTPMLWNNPNVKSGKEQVRGAIGKPEDIADAICFLASDEARFINGTTVVVDGGRLDLL